MHPSIDITDALRNTLPSELHHLVEPLARYIEAATALSALAANPATATAMSQAFTSLPGIEVSAPAGVFTLEAGSQVNELSVRDVAGRDVVNFTINFASPSSSVTQPSHGLDEWQLQLLRAIAARPEPDLLLKLDSLAQQTGLSVEEVDDELKLLEGKGLLKMQWYIGAATGKLTPVARKILRTLDQDASAGPSSGL